MMGRGLWGVWEATWAPGKQAHGYSLMDGVVTSSMAFWTPRPAGTPPPPFPQTWSPHQETKMQDGFEDPATCWYLPLALRPQSIIKASTKSIAWLPGPEGPQVFPYLQ